MSRYDVIAIVNKAVGTFKCISSQFHRYHWSIIPLQRKKQEFIT